MGQKVSAWHSGPSLVAFAAAGTTGPRIWVLSTAPAPAQPCEAFPARAPVCWFVKWSKGPQCWCGGMEGILTIRVWGLEGATEEGVCVILWPVCHWPVCHPLFPFQGDQGERGPVGQPGPQGRQVSGGGQL